MKKTLKILGITLGSIVGIAVIVVFVACYVVFTPKRLTPVVNQVADSLLTCEHRLDNVNLTFWKTFPNFGVAINELYVINPTEGAQSDTVLAIPELVVGVDLKKALDGDIVVKKFVLNNVKANIFIGEDGQTNFDVLKLESDSVQDEDTTAGWKLRSVQLEERVNIYAQTLSFVDQKDSLDARIDNFNMGIEEQTTDSLKGFALDLDAAKVSFRMKNEPYAENLHLRLNVPILTADTTLFHIDGTKLAINEFEINVDGQIGIPDWTKTNYTCDLQVSTNEWQISDVWKLVPPSYSGLWPKEVEADGKLQLIAHAYGRLDSVTMPLADVQVILKDAAGKYTRLPYYFDKVEADIVAHADLNEKDKTTATIHHVYARTGETSVALKGTATDILKSGDKFELDNPLCKVDADLNVSLPDANYWIENDSAHSALKGVLTGKVHAESRLDDITTFDLNKMKVQGDLAINALDVVWQDSTLATADEVTISVAAPKQGFKNKNILSCICKIGIENVHAELLAAKLDARVAGGTLNASVSVDTKAKNKMPIISGGFNLRDLVADLDTIHVHAAAPKGQITQSGSKKDATMPHVQLTFDANALQANMGKDLKVETGKISILADATYNKQAENVLLKWNPRLKFDLQQGKADIAMVGTPIQIPEIKFNYSNRNFVIDTSRIVLGKSDFSLGGEVKGLGKWLNEKGMLVGNLRFTSDQTDVNELLTIVNHFNQQSGAVPQDTTATAAVKKSGDTQSNPFMVPERVDLTLLTSIKKAQVYEETLQNLKGRLYIKDEKVVLEEMGFVCEAAKMQLTAMYKSPRRNHLYAGLDFHLIDIRIDKLIHMFPQLDSIVPMLSTFRGGAQFHLALETYLTEQYKPKVSTIRGACSIEGKDLVLLDNKTFSTISKLLMFSPKTENKVDSISCQIALVEDQVTVYPFCLSIDNYMAAVGGNHYLDMTFNYHASLLKPFYLGVDVGGNFDDLKIKLAKCRYAEDFRPIIHKDAESQSAELRRLISDSLKKNVKIQSSTTETNNP